MEIAIVTFDDFTDLDRETLAGAGQKEKALKSVAPLDTLSVELSRRTRDAVQTPQV